MLQNFHCLPASFFRFSFFFHFLVTFRFLPASLCENCLIFFLHLYSWYPFLTLLLTSFFFYNFIFYAHKVPLKFFCSSSWFSKKKKRKEKTDSILLSQPAGHPEPIRNVNRETQKSLTWVKISEGINLSCHNSEGKNIKKNSALFPC